MHQSLFKVLAFSGLMLSGTVVAADASIKGLVDLRFYNVNSSADGNSYLKGDYGKFRFDDGAGVAVGQLGLQYHVDWENNVSLTLVGNGFADRGNNAIGLTEGYLSYKGVPSEKGWRWQSKLGIFYPQISMENIATAWSTPYTLTSSTINNWIGEELRSTGGQLTLEKLGKFTDSAHSFGATVSLFQNNDPAGAMLAWHGWTIGSRQTLLHEKLRIPYFPALSGELDEQARDSDPFRELDDRWGVHVAASWRYDRALRVNIGYYDNHAQEGIVKQGQYTWTTEFSHIGVKYRLAKQWEVIGQYMQGSTYMTSPTFEDVVNNDYDSGFMMLRHFWANHHLALRLEHFNVDDLDDTQGDNNNENGNAISMAYRYRLNKKSFMLAEYNWIDSDRQARAYLDQPIELIERQFQIGYRYYF
ncbi:hypothetical protein [Thalassotalea euphylliae]|uniref:Porin n=1 Tax=Thalassotalea euphylliae TaxID=1655234 RepID=A0A3E0U5T0_9GAMM|nr:hypothetical protein [Thalassotalea euphylliae]REL32100.1 hypothetical protein DXX94_15995 [Thalassotalea euphylliae]